MRLFWSVTPLAEIALQLAPYGRFMSIHQFGNVASSMPGFGQDGNLVTFVLGEMCVVQSGNFDLAVEGLECYRISPNPSG